MKRILIVDDEPHVIRIMRLALENAGYQVDEAAHGLQAMEYLKEHYPDAMITDIDMPRMNGRELCMEIERAMPERDFPIFVLTARAEDEHRQWSGQLDKLDFMEKPVSIRRMLAMLDNFFAQSTTAGEQACR